MGSVLRSRPDPCSVRHGHDTQLDGERVQGFLQGRTRKGDRERCPRSLSEKPIGLVKVIGREKW